MNRDNISDYVISMFRFYASSGEPDVLKISQLQTTLPSADIHDLKAVAETLCVLEKEGNTETVREIREVYFVRPQQHLRKGEITQRIVSYSLKYYISERTVWRNLARARRRCAEKRNLRIN